MMGALSGLSAFFREWCPSFALNFHCVAHRHDLATHPAFLKAFPSYVENIMKLILGYFKNSGKRKNVLEEIQEQLGLKTLGLLKFNEIRWLSRSNALSRIVINYVPLRRMWEKSNGKNSEVSVEIEGFEDSKLSTLQKEVCSHKFLGSLACCHDTLYQPAEVNRYFQRDVVSYKAVQNVVALACQELEETYLTSDSIGGKEYNKVRAAMRGRKTLDDALIKSEVASINLLSEDQLHKIVSDHLDSRRKSDIHSVTVIDLIQHVGEEVLELQTQQGRKALSDRKKEFSDCLTLFNLKTKNFDIGNSANPASQPINPQIEVCEKEEGGSRVQKRIRKPKEVLTFSKLIEDDKEGAVKLSRKASTVNNPGKSSTAADRRPIKVDGELRFVMDKILQENVKENKFLCAWRGYPESCNTWEPLANMPPVILDKFRNDQDLATRKSLKLIHQDEKRQEPLFTYKYFTEAGINGVDVVVNKGDEKFVSEGVQAYAQDVIDNLKQRFPEEGGSVLSCFDIFHIDSLPDTQKQWDEYRDKYGNKELKTLVSHYGGKQFSTSDRVERFIISSECHTQWRLVRNMMWDAKQKSKQDRQKEDQHKKTQTDNDHLKKSDTELFWMNFLQKNKNPPLISRTSEDWLKFSWS